MTILAQHTFKWLSYDATVLGIGKFIRIREQGKLRDTVKNLDESDRRCRASLDTTSIWLASTVLI